MYGDSSQKRWSGPLCKQRTAPQKMEATCPGNEINKEAKKKQEMFNKMQEVRASWFEILPCWKPTNTNMKWQLLKFEAAVRSRLLHGLETVQLGSKKEWGSTTKNENGNKDKYMYICTCIQTYITLHIIIYTNTNAYMCT